MLKTSLCALLLCAVAAWGPNNPTGDIQSYGGATVNPNMAYGPGGNATANVNWNGYSQSDTTGTETHTSAVALNGNVIVLGSLKLSNAYAGTYVPGFTTPIYSPLVVGNTMDANSLLMFRPGQYSGPQLQFSAADGSIGADLIPHRFITSNDMSTPQFASLGLLTTGMYLPSTGGIQLRVGNVSALTIDGSKNITVPSTSTLTVGSALTLNGAVSSTGLVSSTGIVQLPSSSASAGYLEWGNSTTGVKAFLNGTDRSANIIQFSNTATGQAQLEAQRFLYAGSDNGASQPVFSSAGATGYGFYINNAAPYTALICNTGIALKMDNTLTGYFGAHIYVPNTTSTRIGWGTTSTPDVAFNWRSTGFVTFSTSTTTPNSYGQIGAARQTFSSTAASNSLNPTDSGAVYDNFGATATVKWVLPAISGTPAGYWITFAMAAAQNIQIQPNAADIVYLSASKTAGAGVNCTGRIGGSISIIATAHGWDVISATSVPSSTTPDCG